jgi:HEAT repeat protein
MGVFLILVTAVAVGQAQGPPPTDLKRSIDALSAFDHAPRIEAARQLRRAPAVAAVAALSEAARSHSDQYVRYRALVLLSGFGDRGTAELMRSLLADRNDRVREVAYRWFERHPEPGLTDVLLAALNTEQAEFVRPALIRALAALPSHERVQRALVAEAGRGLDFFRSAVIEALGELRAAYAVDTLAAVAAVEGPLQDDAVLALGRIGDRRAIPALASLTNAPPEVTPALQAAQCLLGDRCDARIAWLVQAARSPAARPETVRAATAALGALASQGTADGLGALMELTSEDGDSPHRDVALTFSAVALRRPNDLIQWLERAPEDVRARGVALLVEGFDSLEEDFAEEHFFAAARAAYWSATEGSSMRQLTAALIEKLDF